MENIIILFIAYFLGAIPWAYIMAKLTKGIDIREHGSGNVGFTNALRTIGKGPAILVFIGDIGKGVIAVLIAKHFGNPTIATLAGFLVVIGHTYPIYLRFKGGKGAAAGFGAFLALLPFEGLLTIAVWAAVSFSTRYVSLGTIVAVIAVPITTIVFHENINYIIFSLVGATFVIIKHRSNIIRLINGTERKMGDKSK